MNALIRIDGYERLQLISLSHALIMADKHKMYCYCHPSQIRHLAKVWLAKAGHDITGKERWAKLNTLFHSVYGEVVADPKKEPTNA